MKVDLDNQPTREQDLGIVTHRLPGNGSLIQWATRYPDLQDRCLLPAQENFAQRLSKALSNDQLKGVGKIDTFRNMLNGKTTYSDQALITFLLGAIQNQREQRGIDTVDHNGLLVVGTCVTDVEAQKILESVNLDASLLLASPLMVRDVSLRQSSNFRNYASWFYQKEVLPEEFGRQPGQYNPDFLIS